MNEDRYCAARQATCACALILLALAPLSCGKKDAPPPVAGPSTNATIAPAAAPAETVDLNQITRDLRRWIVRNQRTPKNFEDFAATTTTPIPAAPPGKKFAIDKTMHVILVKR